MSEKHTSGPWKVMVRAGRGVNIEWVESGDTDQEERPICHLRWTDGMRPQVEARVMADAHLIAAAPDLLEFVRSEHERHRPNGEKARCWTCGIDGGCSARSQTSRLLAKAEGRS